MDIINLSDKDYTVETEIQHQAAEKGLSIYISGLNKLNKKTFAKLTTTIMSMEAAARNKRTLTLSINKNGDAESLEDCIGNKEGIQVNAICTNNPEIASTALPKINRAGNESEN